MNFKYKCLLQQFFSIIPKGEIANFLFQKYIAKVLPPTDDEFVEKVLDAFEHFNKFKDYNQLVSPGKKYYEFGAGWTLTIPLSMAFLNFEVTCIDIRKLIFPELIVDSIEKFISKKDALPFELPKLANEYIPKENVIEYLREKHDLNYSAPTDARKTGFADNSFDFISSSLTLEHIPEKDILPILKECHRILNKGGVMSVTIDYQDHWSYFDKGISRYNFLKYSADQWKKYNPSLHYQNRLRHSDYRKLISQTEFKVAEEILVYPDSEDEKELKTLKLANGFKNYDFADLAIKGSDIVLVKQRR